MRIFGWLRKLPSFFDYRFGKTRINPEFIKDITDEDALRILRAKRNEIVEIMAGGKTYAISRSNSNEDAT